MVAEVFRCVEFVHERRKVQVSEIRIAYRLSHSVGQSAKCVTQHQLVLEAVEWERCLHELEYGEQMRSDGMSALVYDDTKSGTRRCLHLCVDTLAVIRSLISGNIQLR